MCILCPKNTMFSIPLITNNRTTFNPKVRYYYKRTKAVNLKITFPLLCFLVTSIDSLF